MKKGAPTIATNIEMHRTRMPTSCRGADRLRPIMHPKGCRKKRPAEAPREFADAILGHYAAHSKRGGESHRGARGETNRNRYQRSTGCPPPFLAVGAAPGSGG